MKNAGLEEAQDVIKIAVRNINKLRYAYDTTLMAEREYELKSLLINVKEESEKAGLKLSIQKPKILASSPSLCMTYPAQKLNKQGDNVQPWHTHFPMLNQSFVPCCFNCCFLSAYRLLRRQVRWSRIHLSLTIFHSLLWPTQPKALAQSVKQK